MEKKGWCSFSQAITLFKLLEITYDKCQHNWHIQTQNVMHFKNELTLLWVNYVIKKFIWVIFHIVFLSFSSDILERVHQLRDKFYDKLITNHSSGSKNKHNISNDENNNSNEKFHLSNYIPYNHPLKIYSNDNSNDYDMNKQCNSLNTSISNDISSQLTNHNSFQYFNAKLHSTPLISMKTLKTSTNNNKNIKSVVTTSYSQSLDSGIEDVEDTQSINCTQSKQLLQMSQRIFKRNYYNINQPVENEAYEQIIDLSFKKQKQTNHHHYHEEIHQTKEEQNVWRPYLDWWVYILSGLFFYFIFALVTTNQKKYIQLEESINLLLFLYFLFSFILNNFTFSPSNLPYPLLLHS